jgi:signal transduction histidine kinase
VADRSPLVKLSSRIISTSSFRLTLRYALLFALSVVVLGVSVYYQMSFFGEIQQDEVLEEEVDAIERAVEDEPREKVIDVVEDHMRHPPGMLIRYRLLDEHGDSLAGNLPEVEPQEGYFWFVGPRADRPDRTDRIRALGEQLDDDLLLIVAQDFEAQEELDELREVIARDFGYAAALTVLLALVGGMLMSASVLRRVDAVNQTAREIVGSSDLSRRLPVRGSGDEFDRLAESVNSMLERMEAQMDAMRQVSSDIAHDLRTPLTRLRNQLESATKLDDRERLRAAQERSLQEIDQLLVTFTALLRIAQIEAADRAAHQAPFDFSEVLSTLVEVYQPTVDAKGQSLRAHVEPGLTVTGDRDLIAQLFANLLDNASHHSPRGASIELHARRTQGGVEVVVADDGPGIPPDEHAKVFRRLYRLERSRTTAGSGLGLALVAAIAGMHQARVDLTDNGPGLEVRVLIP